MTYEELLQEADAEGLITKEKDLLSADGRIKGKSIAIRRDMPTVNKACTLAEELAHSELTVGNILDVSNTQNRKQEYVARLRTYDKMIGLMGIVQGHQARCCSLYELAEFLSVTENFLHDALACYRAKYGFLAELDNCVIFFEPSLSVYEKLD